MPVLEKLPLLPLLPLLSKTHIELPNILQSMCSIGVWGQWGLIGAGLPKYIRETLHELIANLRRGNSQATRKQSGWSRTLAASMRRSPTVLHLPQARVPDSLHASTGNGFRFVWSLPKVLCFGMIRQGN